MAELKFKDVVKAYGKTEVIHGLDLDIRDREFLVLVGPSGCGKSTLLRMVAGLEEISGGTIAIDGRVVNDVAPKDRGLSMVFQNYALYPHMNVFDNMSFGLKLSKTPKAEIRERVEEVAAILGLEDLLTRKPHELSGGQRQRVAMGRAMVRKPSIFLFDEPLSNLDAKLRIQMRAEIKLLHQRVDST
ncbi:MAG: ATP-binding cassette domain-containing protein, partial [Desulfobacterales bacterium]|nr:ATP-binding cassette domain-containing protein [Desulfobacterales bacterium]